MNLDGTAQLTFVLGRLLGQNVTLERLAPLDGTATTNHKALGSAFFGFHFRHEITRLICVCGWSPGKLADTCMTQNRHLFFSLPAARTDPNRGKALDYRVILEGLSRYQRDFLQLNRCWQAIKENKKRSPRPDVCRHRRSDQSLRKAAPSSTHFTSPPCCWQFQGLDHPRFYNTLLSGLPQHRWPSDQTVAAQQFISCTACVTSIFKTFIPHIKTSFKYK